MSRIFASGSVAAFGRKPEPSLIENAALFRAAATIAAFRQQPRNDDEQHHDHDSQNPPKQHPAFPRHFIFLPRRFLELLLGGQRRDFFVRRQQLAGDEAQIVARRRHARIAVVQEKFVVRFRFEQNARHGIKRREFFQFNRRIVAILRFEKQRVALRRAVQRQGKFLRFAVRRLRPRRAAERMLVFVAAVVGQFLVKRQRTFKQRCWRSTRQSRQRQIGLRQFDDPAAQLRIFRVIRRRDRQRQRTADGRVLDEVRHLVAAAHHAQITQTRLRVREHVEIEFDLLRAGAGDFHRLAEFPFRNVERRAGHFEAGQDFGRVKIRIVRRRRDLNRRDRDGFQIHAQRRQIVARRGAAGVAGQQMEGARLTRQKHEINRTPLRPHGFDEAAAGCRRF